MMNTWTTFPFFLTKDDIAQLVIKWSAPWLLSIDVVECIMGTNDECVADTSKLALKEKKK